MPQTTRIIENDDGGVPWEPLPEHLPYILARAEHDTWQFFVGLENGMVVQFSNATIRGQWVTLNEPIVLSGPPLPIELFATDRGLEVRISAIVWCADQAS